MEPHVFIDRKESDKNSLCVFIRDLDESVTEAQIRIEDSTWIQIGVTQGTSDKIIFSELEPNKFYKIEGIYNLDGVWMQSHSGVFSLSPKKIIPSQLPERPKGAGITSQQYTEKNKITPPIGVIANA